ncbi:MULTISPECIES: glycosyltransferase family 2 protein [unclassified Psychrobacter]|uniref:glycosyltransferase family 2 protein n=1 Tax=unclassified Psychrobacter TaxID=196806 RepID=UPI0025E691C4|nr:MULTISPECIES: glycosyltransferase family 2 protein [unclassified Psychrobacter]
MNRANISVVVPFYNSVDTIERAVNSVISQSLQPKEIIIVDDKSSEAASEFIKSLVEITSNKTDINLLLFTMQMNSGAGEARNLGWLKASGEFIAFLDADDMWLPNKLEIQYGFFKSDPDLILCGHKYIVAKDENMLCNMSHTSKIKKDIFNNFMVITKKRQLLRNRFATSTVMIKNTINNRFEKNKRYSEDFLLWSEIISSGHKAVKIETSLTVYFKSVFGDSGLSSNLSKMFIGNLKSYKTLYKKGFIKLSCFFIYTSISCIRFIRRVLIVFIRNI